MGNAALLPTPLQHPGREVTPIAKTFNNLYMDIRQALLEQGVSMASLEARAMLLHVTGKDKAALIRDAHLYVPPEEESQMHELLQLRLQGKPIAYLLGLWEFYGLPMKITPDVLIPRVDTEILAQVGIELASRAGDSPRVLDLCTGSGCVGLAIAAHVPRCRVVLADISEAALKVARRNIRHLNLSARVACVSVDALSPWPSTLGHFDLIVCNPPYVRTEDWSTLESSVRDFEPRLALDGGADGLRFYRSLAAGWRQALTPSGTLAVECGYDAADAVADILFRAAFGRIERRMDTAGIPRVVLGAPVWQDSIRDGIADTDPVGGRG